MQSISTDNTLRQLYSDLTLAGLMPLWTQRADLMPISPAPAARPHVWKWKTVRPLARRAGELVPVGRGGERRAIALANPGLGGLPYATPTIWAAVQYLGPRETAPTHRHTQGAFRFVLEGQGVWTVVDGDAIAMRRGDLLLTPNWAWHGHNNAGDIPMTWLDGLDIPLVAYLDAGFFEFGPERLTEQATPEFSRAEVLWAHPGLYPIGVASPPISPLTAYRWAETDDALSAQLDLDQAGLEGAIEHGHAGVRFINPSTGRDALVTLRTEMHRLQPGIRTTKYRQAGSAVWEVFEGEGTIYLGEESVEVASGDLVAVPSWCWLQIEARTKLDLFTFSDTPVLDALGLTRIQRDPGVGK